MSHGLPQKKKRPFNAGLYAGLMALFGADNPAVIHAAPKRPTPRHVIMYYKERAQNKRVRKANRGPGFSQERS